MYAVTYAEYGGPEVLTLGEAPEPHAGPGQVRIAVRAASINPLDWKIREGSMAGGHPLESPGVPGFDAAGVIDEVGEGVASFAVGDDVFGLGSATQAEFAVLTAWARKPASLDWSVAAAAGVVVETAERGLRLLGVGEGSTLFVDGGAGGVGAVVVQMAVARGSRVVASASQPNHDYLREIGATPVLYGEGLVNRVLAVPGVKVDAVFDAAGKTPLAELTGLVSDPAQVLTIANFDVGDTGARVTTGGGDSRPGPALSEGAGLLRDSKVVIQVQTFPFDRAAEAYRLSQEGHTRGKLVLVP